MAHYRKKPVVIEARPVNSYLDLPGVAHWVKSNGGNLVHVDGELHGYIETLEGAMRVTVGDFVVMGVDGEFYPCKGSIFRKTYELVDDHVVV